MHIKKVELENIKSHADATFEFERGTTAISGENGAGKTTIIEAIAWALFDLLSYKKEEFLSRGAKKGSVRITFESGLDEREYTVYRDTQTGYYVYDPALKLRIADKKEEVTRFLWQHLGVEAGTDLETLFKHAIGVPQGTFTAIFIATAAERKRTFDTLLKVEEYRKGAEELLKTSRLIDQQIMSVNIKIARGEGEISRIEPIETELKMFAERVAELRRELSMLESRITEKSESVKLLDEADTRLSGLFAQIEAYKNERSTAELIHSQRLAELEASRKATALLAEIKPDADRHTEMLAVIRGFEGERSERQNLRDEVVRLERTLSRLGSDRNRRAVELERISEAEGQIEMLKTSVAEQENLESAAARLRVEAAKAASAEVQISRMNERLDRLREAYRINTSQLTAANEKAAAASDLTSLQQRDGEIVHQVANLKAALDRDEAFQREINNGLCPILSEKCLNLKNGQTLEGFVTSKFGDLRTQIGTLEKERAAVSSALTASREAERHLTQIPTLEERKRELNEEGQRLKTEKEAIESEIAAFAESANELKKIEAELTTLGNPKARISILASDVARRNETVSQLASLDRELEQYDKQKQAFEKKIDAFKELDTRWSEAAAARDATAEAYRSYIVNEPAANQLEPREQALAAVEKELSAVTERLTFAEADYEKASGSYDRERHQTERQALSDLEKRHFELHTTFGVAAQREAELTKELERLEAIRRSMQNEFREKEDLEKTAEATDFIRTTLKDAAPLVARNYVWHVSQEANLIFREITGNAERSLKWGEDYGIILEEGGYERPFVSLSGGEQMSAALSVRLALLKQLSDIRLAFFDEPTTNLDVERRENLAQQIARIGHFDQLIVISHDDTFEGYMDHEMRVER